MSDTLAILMGAFSIGLSVFLAIVALNDGLWSDEPDLFAPLRRWAAILVFFTWLWPLALAALIVYQVYRVIRIAVGVEDSR